VQKGLESTTFALLAGFSNFGATVSSQIGIFVTQVPRRAAPGGGERDGPAAWGRRRWAAKRRGSEQGGRCRNRCGEARAGSTEKRRVARPVAVLAQVRARGDATGEPGARACGWTSWARPAACCCGWTRREAAEAGEGGRGVIDRVVDTVSSTAGWVQEAGVSTTEPCDFKNLSMLVFVCHCLLPLLAVPLVFLLIPNKLMTESLDDPAPAETPADEVVAERPHAA
jgi:hypothetical protein